MTVVRAEKICFSGPKLKVEVVVHIWCLRGGSVAIAASEMELPSVTMTRTPPSGKVHFARVHFARVVLPRCSRRVKSLPFDAVSGIVVLSSLDCITVNWDRRTVVIISG